LTTSAIDVSGSPASQIEAKLRGVPVREPGSERMIDVSPAQMRELRLPWTPLVKTKLGEWLIKASGQRFKGQGLIGADALAVSDGFRSLQGDDFARYNFPQVWVERRQIPRAINGRIPSRNAVVLDLGCGPGTSTEVLCRFAEPNWTIVGYDLTAEYIDQARSRAARGGFANERGQPIRPHFIRQDIGTPLISPTGSRLAESSVDFAMSGGVVGLYMGRKGVEGLARELRRALRPGGYAALDSGPSCSPRQLREIGEAAGFKYIAQVRSCRIDPRPKIILRSPIG
jgi:SAM-dependent methyltransferase